MPSTQVQSDQLLTVMDRAVQFVQPDIAQPEVALAIFEGLSQFSDFGEIDRGTATYQATLLRSQLPVSYEQTASLLEKDLTTLERDPEQIVAWADAVITWAKMAITKKGIQTDKILERLERAKEIFIKNRRQQDLAPVYALLTAADALEHDFESAERHSRKAIRLFRTYGFASMGTPVTTPMQDILLRGGISAS
ncbi:MAG TPA: hypothetical protein VLF21_02130 [Candidatus Saccharimonadales bacterium]|nr:hypothetical protein [Candidatus Saccharimonadales bacterium]